MAKAKKSMVEKQQSADVAEQAHRLAHELGLAHGHSHTEENDHALILLYKLLYCISKLFDLI